MDDSDVNQRNTNTNHFVPLFESDYEEDINPNTKSKKNPVIVLSEDEDADKHKGEQNGNNEEDDVNDEK